MATRWEAILDDVEATLEGITIAAGYHQDVARVERGVRGPHEREVVPPWLGFARIGSAEIESRTGKEISLNMTLAVVGVVQASQGDDLQTAVARLEYDVRKALAADPTRDANAVGTWPTSVDTDDGEPDNGPARRGYFVAQFKIRFDEDLA